MFGKFVIQAIINHDIHHQYSQLDRRKLSSESKRSNLFLSTITAKISEALAEIYNNNCNFTA